MTWAGLSLLVAAGGAAGALSRFWVGVAAVAAFGPAWPVGTLLVNVVGSFLIGAVATAAWGSAPLKAGVITGFLGGFTTFSAFSLETVRLVEGGRSGQAALYVALSVALCIAAAAAGVALARSGV